MNNFLSIFFFLSIPTALFGQDASSAFHGATRLEIGYPHAGSYGKERASFALEQTFTYSINKRFAAGIGVGFALYPGAFTLPLHTIATYSFNIKNAHFNWNHRLGMNLKVSENSFFGFRYNSDVRWIIPLQSKMNAFIGAGGNFLWDRWGGKSLSGAFNVGIVYRI